MIKPIHFAGKPKRYSHKRSKALIHPLKRGQIVEVVLPQNYNNIHAGDAPPELLGLSPQALDDFTQRYATNGGAVAIENITT